MKYRASQKTYIYAAIPCFLTNPEPYNLITESSKKLDNKIFF